MWSVRGVLLALLFAIHMPLFGQEITPDIANRTPEEVFAELKVKAQIFSQDSTVGRRRVANHRFIQELGRLIKSRKGWDLPWQELTSIATLNSPDKAWKILTWSVLLDQNARRHYGCIFNKSGHIFPLLDQQSNQFDDLEIYDNKAWPGAVYYEVLPIQALSNGLNCFAVLGLDKREPFSQRKVLDWICPDQVGDQVKLGAPLIVCRGQRNSRMQWNYPHDVQVQVFWDAMKSALIFDHLIPRGEDPSSSHFDFIPDGSFDALLWKNGIFTFQELPNYQPSK